MFVGVSASRIGWVGLLVKMSHNNITIDETARGQLMTYTRQFLVPHP